MRLLYKFQSDGIWYSRNGELAFRRGERPACAIDRMEGYKATCSHHIARPRAGGDYSRELVMFYAKQPIQSE